MFPYSCDKQYNYDILYVVCVYLIQQNNSEAEREGTQNQQAMLLTVAFEFSLGEWKYIDVREVLVFVLLRKYDSGYRESNKVIWKLMRHG